MAQGSSGARADCWSIVDSALANEKRKKDTYAFEKDASRFGDRDQVLVFAKPIKGVDNLRACENGVDVSGVCVKPHENREDLKRISGKATTATIKLLNGSFVV